MNTGEQATPQLERRPVNSGLLLAASDDSPSPAEIARQLEPLIAAHLEQSAWWPDHELREGWMLGDYSLYAIGFPAAGFKSLYVRFISEPHREAMLEVSSSREDPDLKDAAPIAMNESLRGLGFEKPVRMESADDCRLLAQEIAGLITGCLGYDARAPIVYRKEFGGARNRAAYFSH